MKALTLAGYDGVSSLKFADPAIPDPQPHDVVIKVHAASVNPIDYRITQGYLRGRVELALPHVLGRDCSGTVIKVGSEVREFAVGDEVYGVADQIRWGTHAEYTAIDIATVARKPENVDHVQAASLPVAALSAWSGLVTVGQVQRGQNVLIHRGSGGVGSFAIQIAKHFGANVAATGGTASQGYLRSLGVDIAIDYSKADFADVIKDCDLVLDLIGGDVRYQSFRVVKPGGAIVHISVPPMTQPAPRSDIAVKAAVVKYDASLLDEVSALVRSGAIKPQVSAVYPFADSIKAYEHVMSGHARGKIVIDMSPKN